MPSVPAGSPPPPTPPPAPVRVPVSCSRVHSESSSLVLRAARSLVAEIKSEYVEETLENASIGHGSASPALTQGQREGGGEQTQTQT